MSSSSLVPSVPVRGISQPKGAASGLKVSVMMAFLLGSLLFGALLGIIIPPIKSPDEGAHLKRAWMLSQGQWMLFSQSCNAEDLGKTRCLNGKSMSGGMIDSNFEKWLALHEPLERRKESELDRQLADSVRLSGDSVFRIVPGTGYYFPVIYTPQAAAIMLGRWLDLRVSYVYRLARIFTFASGILVLLAAFRIYSQHVVALAFLFLPMSLFQSVAASIDFFSSALFMLGVACFLRLEKGRGEESAWLFVIMGVAWFIAASARTHVAPVILLMLVPARFYRRPLPWCASILTLMAMLAWIIIAFKWTVDFRIPRPISTMEIARYYLESPVSLWDVMARTLSDEGMRYSYFISFLGVFFDQTLSHDVYVVLFVLLVGVVLASLVSFGEWKDSWRPRLALLLVGVSACFLAFLAMLLTWSPHPAKFVEGVQGRYLLIPVFLAVTGLVSWRSVNGRRAWLRNGLLLALAGLAAISSVQRLLDSYYMQRFVQAGFSEPLAAQGRVLPSPALGPEVKSIALKLHGEGLPPQGVSDTWMGILVGTYGRSLRGQARLLLGHGSEDRQVVDVDLSGMKDNQYVFLKIPPGRYTEGELISEKGGGFSVWELHQQAESGTAGVEKVLTCVAMIRSDNSSWITPGCPPVR